MCKGLYLPCQKQYFFRMCSIYEGIESIAWKKKEIKFVEEKKWVAVGKMIIISCNHWFVWYRLIHMVRKNFHYYLAIPTRGIFNNSEAVLVNEKQQQQHQAEKKTTHLRKKKKTECQFNEMVAAQDTDTKWVDRWRTTCERKGSTVTSGNNRCTETSVPNFHFFFLNLYRAVPLLCQVKRNWEGTECQTVRRNITGAYHHMHNSNETPSAKRQHIFLFFSFRCCCCCSFAPFRSASLSLVYLW